MGDTELDGDGSQAATAASPKVPMQAMNSPRRESGIAAAIRVCAGNVGTSAFMCTPGARNRGVG
jgi:hypothetical protein